MSIRLTNSETKQWRRCKRAWFLNYYEGFQRVSFDFNKPLTVGSRIHDVLAHYYVPHGTAKPIPMDFLEAGIAADLEAHPQFRKSIEKEADLCRAMLEGYFEWLEETGSDAEFQVVEPEIEMEVPLLPDHGVTLLSKIDARVRDVDAGSIGAFEHKTVQSLTEPLHKLQVDSQLLTEHLVEFLHQLGMPDGPEERAEFVVYNMLRKVKRTAQAKPPFYARERVTHNVEELRNHWRHVVRVALEIHHVTGLLDAGFDHHDYCPPSPTDDCHWECEFSGLCLSGLMDDGSDWRASAAEDYVVGDPLERYRTSVGLTPRPHHAEAVESPAVSEEPSA